MKRQKTSVSHPRDAPSNKINPFARLIANQRIAVVDEFELEGGRRLREVEVAFKTWGRLNQKADNVMVICHALSGSSDIEDWWGPLLGAGKAFDPSRYFIFCANTLGSPYGTSSPCTVNPETGERYGPEFPGTTIRDDVHLQKLILDDLGVKSVALVVGGSMGGMQVLEWPLCTPPGYVRNIIPIATSGRHSAWGISWGETQRQSIYSDPEYMDGYYSYDKPPTAGLSAARMAALLTYRSRDSFQDRFGRKEQPRQRIDDGPRTPGEHAAAAHNDGHARVKSRGSRQSSNGTQSPTIAQEVPALDPPPSSASAIFAAQSYLRYQGKKFVSRFDANCYISITRKMDTHDIARGRESWSAAVQALPSHALIIAISSDGLFTLSEMKELADEMEDATFQVITSQEGHDGFLLEFEQLDRIVTAHLRDRLPELYSGEPLLEVGAENGYEVARASLTGEADPDLDVSRW